MSISLLSDSGPKFRVAICGAGIGGLVLAITIGKYGPLIPVDVYEAHNSIETAGVGIALWKQTHEVLQELGLLNDFKQFFTKSETGPKTWRSDIPQGGYLWWHREHAPPSMHRQQMIAILERCLPASCRIHLKKRLVAYTELQRQDAHSVLPGPIQLDFADGTTATTEVLIGADGIRSVVRKTLFETATNEDTGNEATDLGKYIDTTFTGISVYRFLISAETLGKENPENRSLKGLTAYNGKGRYLITYPIAHGTLINVVAFVNNPSLTDTRYEEHWVAETTREEVVNQFDDFELDVKEVVKLCEKPSRWALHTVNPLPFCVRKRVALIGDACHAMAPFHAAGAGQAIDDAFVLGRLITHPLTTLSRIPDVLRIYETIRLPFAQTIASLSLSTGRMYMFTETGYYDGTRKHVDQDERGISAYEREGIAAMKQELSRRWEWIDCSRSAVQAWEEADLKLQALVE